MAHNETAEGRGRPWLAGVFAAASLVLLSAACFVTLANFDPRAVALMTEERKLAFENALAEHAVSQYSTAGQEGIQDPDSFHRESDGIQTALAKSKATHDKFQVLQFRKDRDDLDQQNEKNAGYLAKILAIQEAKQKKEDEERLARWKQHRESLGAHVRLMRKTNIILNAADDREGEKLAKQNAAAAKLAKNVLTEYEGQQAQDFHNQINEFQTNQARLAADIVGEKDTHGPSLAEMQLLKQNEKAASCLSSGGYRTGEC